jgi:hypothetical protein
MVKKNAKISRPSLNYREAYLRDALRWAMLVYMRREGLSYQEFPDKIELAVRDLGGYDKKGQPINPAFRPDGKRYWITAKTLRNFLGPPSEESVPKGERLHPAQIRVMRQFIEVKLGDYAQTFTPDGLTTQYGDFTSRLLFANAENPAKQVFRDRSLRLLPRRTFYAEGDGHSMFAAFRHIPKSQYLKMFLIVVPDKWDFELFKSSDPKNIERQVSSLRSYLADDRNKLAKWHGVMIPDLSEFKFANARYLHYLKNFDGKIVPALAHVHVIGGSPYYLTIHSWFFEEKRLVFQPPNELLPHYNFKEIPITGFDIVFDKAFGYVK